MSIYDAIMWRTSVRSYLPATLTDGQRARLSQMSAAATAPFGGRIAISLIKAGDGGETRPGTYGVIRGARDFFVIATDGSPEAKLSAGYAFERIVLEAAAMELGTCWLAVTFRGNAFGRAAGVPDGMEVTAVSPVGIPAGKRHLMERITRAVIRESARRDFNSMFFFGDFNTPVPSGSHFTRALEAVRRAPSSVNSQPWRAVVARDGLRVHFYFTRPGDCTMLDMGIALCHFAEACSCDGIEGDFITVEDAPAHPKMTYLRTFIGK